MKVHKQMSTVNYYPNIDAVRRVNLFLENKFGIRHFDNEDDRYSHFGANKKIIKFQKKTNRLAERSEISGKQPDETELLKLMADSEVFSYILSLKRPYLIDVICFSLGLIQSHNIEGEILEIGCHLGVLSNCLAKEVPNKILGIDPQVMAIQKARSRARNIPTLDFDVQRIPFQSKRKFELIVCSHVLEHIDDANHQESLENLSDLLTPQGYLLLNSTMLTDEAFVNKLRQVSETNQLGYIASDCIGGLFSPESEFVKPYESEPVLIIQKGAVQLIPENFLDIGADEWDNHFKDYANTPDVPNQEKTQAFERALRGAR